MSARILRVAATGVLVLALPLPAAAQTETERVHRVIPLAAGGTVKVKNFSGRVRITGTDRSEVVIDATRRAPKERLGRVKLDIQATGASVVIEANKRESSWWHWGDSRHTVVSTDFEIQVPSRTNLDVSVFESPVTVIGVHGSHDLHGFSSDVLLQDATGPVDVKTFSGDIDIQMADSARAPDLQLATFSGDIRVRVPRDARAAVSFSSFSGDLNSDLPLTFQSRSRHRLRAQLNAGGGAAADTRTVNDLQFKTFSGDVQITK